MPGTTIDAGPGASEQLAPRVAALVRVLEQQHARSDVADFVVRLLFCMFADAVGLLPAGCWPSSAARPRMSSAHSSKPCAAAGPCAGVGSSALVPRSWPSCSACCSRSRTAAGRWLGNDPRYNGIACFSTFPFPDPPRGLRSVIADLASAIDELRKRMRRDDPGWTLARIHARLQAGAADDEDARLGALRDLAQSLDQRVGEAYGVEPDEDALLGTLVQLNSERHRK